MSDVPTELHREILLRLPAETLFRFRSVCKSWLRIIDDPLFVRTHTTNNHLSSPNLLTRSGTGILHSFPLDSLNYVNGQQTVHVRSLGHSGMLWMPMCNGLLLIYPHESSKIWAIWNPLNDTLQHLPQPDCEEEEEDRRCLIGSGIGYDSNSDDYKVVRIDTIKNQDGAPNRTLIYSLKSNSWKRTQDCPHHHLPHYTGALFFEGALHWTLSSAIVALDMATEEYRLLVPPMKSIGLLFTLGGCLVMTTGWEMEGAWVMRGYGGGDEDPFWEELFSSERRSVIGGVSGGMVPLAYNETQRRLILQNGDTIIRWDIEKGAVKRVTIDGLQSRHLYSRGFPGSLFRLNHGPIGAAAGTRSAKRRKSEAIKRLKFTATTIDS